jgi:hypothetical protein
VRVIVRSPAAFIVPAIGEDGNELIVLSAIAHVPMTPESNRAIIRRD